MNPGHGSVARDEGVNNTMATCEQCQTEFGKKIRRATCFVCGRKLCRFCYPNKDHACSKCQAKYAAQANRKQPWHDTVIWAFGMKLFGRIMRRGACRDIYVRRFRRRGQDPGTAEAAYEG